jgi:hypothetical protein
MKKRSNLRVIDRGTRYDMSGNLRALVRSIESGVIYPRDVIVLTSQIVRNNASKTVTMHHFGHVTVQDIHWMLATAAGRIEPQ